MIALLLKDLKASALPLAAVLVLCLLTSRTAARAEEALFWLSIGFTVGLWVVPAVVDWQVDADRFICSLPVDRTTVVWTRGAWMVGAAAAGAVFWAATGLLWRTVSEDLGQTPGAPMWQSVEGFLAFGAVAASLAALFLPCYFRFGIGKGSAMFGFLALALVGAVTGLTSLGVIEPSGAADRAGIGNLLPAAAVIGGFAHLRGSFGVLGAIVLLGAGVASASGLAVRMAVSFYERREF